MTTALSCTTSGDTTSLGFASACGADEHKLIKRYSIGYFHIDITEV